MSLGSTTSRNDYTGNGSTDTYSYTFKIFADADLLVTERDTNDVETTHVLTTDYTVTGAGLSTGGTITLVAGNLTTGHVLSIRRRRTLTQTTDFKNQATFSAISHEDALDHLMMIAQQHQDELDRCVKLPETLVSSTFDPELPTDIDDNAGKTLTVNSSGNGIALDDAAGSVTVSATGPTDNVNVQDKKVVKVDSSSNSVTIGGFINGVNNQVIHVVRTSTANTVTLEHNEGTGNQDIFLADEVDHALTTYGGWTLVCDGTNWYEVGY